MYKILETREDFYEYIKGDISFNVFDMSDGEADITKQYCRLVDFYQRLTVTLPKNKEKLNVILHTAMRNFEKCLHYLLIPDNNAAYLRLRVLTENFILLKFLLTNDSSYTDKWYMWSLLSLPKQLTETERGQEITAYALRLRREYDAIDGKKPEFEQLLKNNYGWTFPAIRSNINFQRIADYCDESDMYDNFVRFSAEIHANTSLQNWESRFEHMTYQFALDAAQLMDAYVSLLLNYISAPKTNAKVFLSLYEALADNASSYLNEHYAKMKALMR